MNMLNITEAIANLKSENERELAVFQKSAFPWHALEMLGRIAARHSTIRVLEDYQKNPDGHKDRLIYKLRLDRIGNISGRSTSVWENAKKTEELEGMWDAAEMLGYTK